MCINREKAYITIQNKSKYPKKYENMVKPTSKEM